MSKACILRSKIPEDIQLRIEKCHLRPHCLQTLKANTHFNYAKVLGELKLVIDYASSLAHPWYGGNYISWNWEDVQCIEYFADICLHYNRHKYELLH